MTDTEREIAELLPCTYPTYCIVIHGGHAPSCEATKRPAILAYIERRDAELLRRAAEARSEAVAEEREAQRVRLRHHAIERVTDPDGTEHDFRCRLCGPRFDPQTWADEESMEHAENCPLIRARGSK